MRRRPNPLTVTAQNPIKKREDRANLLAFLYKKASPRKQRQTKGCWLCNSFPSPAEHASEVFKQTGVCLECRTLIDSACESSALELPDANEEANANPQTEEPSSPPDPAVPGDLPG